MMRNNTLLQPSSFRLKSLFVMSEGKVLRNESDFNQLVETNKSALLVLHFLADWAPQCAQVTDVLKELSKDKSVGNVKFLEIEAEEVPEVSMKYEIEAVPTVIMVHQGKVVERVNGVKIAELTQKVRQHAPKTGITAKPVQKEDINTRLKRLINSAEVMLFMKGSPDAPRCGFSRTITSLFNERNVKYSAFDILNDEEVRQALKTYSNWPTYPQVYVNGELIGGLDIIKELVANDEFDETFPKEVPLSERLSALTQRSPIMLFMKGDREQPRCGFSRTAISMLNEKGVEYGTFDILSDEEVRQGLKEFSNWPTYPQIYVKGELLGGLDIMKELDSAGELAEALSPS